jgi:hypothetical protein
MPVGRQNIPPPEQSRKARKPATTPDARESQMVSLAERLAERQLRDGSASAQVLTHFLKLGTARERKELARLDGEIELQKAKIDALGSTKRLEKLYETAMAAFRGYQGISSNDESEDDE